MRLSDVFACSAGASAKGVNTLQGKDHSSAKQEAGKERWRVWRDLELLAGRALKRALMVSWDFWRTRVRRARLARKAASKWTSASASAAWRAWEEHVCRAKVRLVVMQLTPSIDTGTLLRLFFGMIPKWHLQ